MKKFIKTTYYFLTSRVFLVNLLAAIVFLFLLITMTFCGIRSYTNHGKNLPTPNLIGYNLEDLETKSIANLKEVTPVVNDSSQIVWENQDSCILKPAGYIVSQTPVPSHMIKKGRSIRLSITPVEQPLITLSYDAIYTPSSYKTVFNYLKNNNICYEVKGIPVYSDIGKSREELNKVQKLGIEGEIVSTLIENKPITLKRGSKVTLYVDKDGLRYERTGGIPASVPKLIGYKDLELARDYVSSFGHKMKIMNQVPDSLLNQVKIIKQEPMPGGDLIDKGSTIKVWIE